MGQASHLTVWSLAWGTICLKFHRFPCWYGFLQFPPRHIVAAINCPLVGMSTWWTSASGIDFNLGSISKPNLLLHLFTFLYLRVKSYFFGSYKGDKNDLNRFPVSILALRSEGYRKVPYHYYEAGSRDECAEYVLHESAPYGGHRFITEKMVFAKWAKSHRIKFSHPEWQPSWPTQNDGVSWAPMSFWSKHSPVLMQKQTATNRPEQLSQHVPDYTLILQRDSRREDRFVGMFMVLGHPHVFLKDNRTMP